jgi:hypothetical protein
VRVLCVLAKLKKGLPVLMGLVEQIITHSFRSAGALFGMGKKYDQNSLPKKKWQFLPHCVGKKVCASQTLGKQG